MRFNLSHFFALFALVFIVISPSRAEDRDFETQFGKLATEHCVDCHGPDVQRSKLRLDTLPLKLTDKDVAASWTKVFDRVSRGEMPPKSKERPPEKDTQATLTGLQKQL